MRKTGFVYDDKYMLHDTGQFHPEIPERIQAVIQGIKGADLLPKLVLITPENADLKWIETVHPKDYIQRLEESCVLGHTEFECPDNQMCGETYDVALLAVGGVLKATRFMMEGKIDNAFCAVRPPGHHAETNRAMGFCYFNNVAIAARYLQIEWGIKRVGIVDFDASIFRISFLKLIISCSERTKERATASTSCERPKARSSLSFVVNDWISNFAPGRFNPL